MSAEVIFPDDSRWTGSKRLAARGLVRLPGSLVSGVGGCKLPPGPDVLVLAADESGATYSEITLTFNGTAVTLFGTELGAPASFDLDPILIPTITIPGHPTGPQHSAVCGGDELSDTNPDARPSQL
ncbi:hypothetical protein EXIGLDRAFT_781861 [Exidia glandulosa HHB12029]|uniref:Uncharacterized protein n=1 Tax=Exidia glandulosa HHB12029 TaxID=1314781 RepID=A0A165B4B7_EXIGL|nr:hypothetical protein EXIGLDRAFT_781861 [Exidia glandulosa HHB12029]